MNRSIRLITSLTILALAVPSSVVAREARPEPKRSGERADSERYEFDTPYGIRGGGARVTVKAPIRTVHHVIADFGHYSDFIPKFQKSRIVGRVGGDTDVYLEVPIVHGTAKIWAVLRFGAMKTVDGWDTIDARLIKGNVKRLDAKWRVKRIDDDHTQVNLEMILVMKVPLPASLVVGEVAYASNVAVRGARDRSEGRSARR